MASHPHWILHIGAHKTGTTQFQDILESQRGHLRAQGLDYLPRRDVRNAKLKSLVMNRKYGILSMSRWRKRTFDDHTRGMRSDSPLAFMSEENMIGTVTDILSNPIYPALERNLHAWADLFEGKTVDIYFSIRNYSYLLVSAYAEAIRGGVILPPIGQYYKNFLLNDRPDWSSVVDRIIAAWPAANVRVWSLEKYSRNKFEIMERITGCSILRNEIEIPRETRTPSALTVEKSLLIDHGLTKKDRKRRIAALFAEDDFKEKFAPFSDREIEHLTELYHTDIAKMMLAHPGIMLDGDL